MPSPALLCACALALCAFACTSQSKKSVDSPASTTNEVQLTVVRSVQQDSLVHTTDTLMRSVRIDLAQRPVDLYFCRDSLRLPVILPAGGFARNKAQEKECNWDIYPSTVRCCTYDSLGYVVHLAVNSPEATQEWKYVYDSSRRVVECKGWWTSCSVLYDAHSRVARLQMQHNGKLSQYNFVYAP